MGYAWIGVAALGVRLFHLWQTHGALVSRTLMGDAAAYDAWARRIVGGEWLGHDVFYQSPLYPYFLAAIYAVTGGSVTAARLTQSILGAVACVLVALAGERFFSRRTGWIAGLLLAVYPAAIFFDGIIQKSSLDLFLFSVVLVLVATATPARRPAAWIGFGVALGLLVLNRENASVLVLPLGVWIAWLHGGRARRWLVAGSACAVGTALVLGTVAARNRIVGGETFFTTSQFGTNFYIGNRAGATGRYDPLLWGNGRAEDEREDAVALAEKAAHRKLSPGEVSRFWFGLAWRWMSAHPLDWLRLERAKLAYAFNAGEITDTEDQYTWGDSSWVLRATNPVLHFGVLVPLAAVGVVVAWPGRRCVWILWALAATYTGSVLLFFVNGRYRYPLVPIVLLFAAAALAHSWRRTIAERRWITVAAAATLAVALAVSTNAPLVDVPTMRAVTQMNLGTYAAEAGDKALAAECFRRAIALAPDFAEAHYNLGLALVEMDRLDDAIGPFQRAAALAPNESKARRALRWIEAKKRGEAD